MSLSPQVLTALGGVADDIDADGYDEMLISAAQWARMVLSIGIPVFYGGQTMGVNMKSSPHVPDGIGILRRRKKVVGVVDFRNGKLVLLGKAT